MEEKDLSLLNHILRSLTEFPEKIRVERIVDIGGVLMTVYADPVDLGRIIGREGVIVESIRNIMHALGAKNGQKTSVKIYDPKCR